MMEELYVAITHLCRRAVYLLASALCALRDLPAAGAWLWLVRATAPGGLAAKNIQTGALAPEPAAPVGVVLLHHLPGLLLATGTEVFRHG
jgi:hypothetical protein